MTEEWVEFPDHSDYFVSSLGRVINRRTGVERIPRADKFGYLKINIVVKGVHTTYYLHRLVGASFLEGYDPKGMIRFANGDKSDCRAENLKTFESKSNRKFRLRGKSRVHARRVRIVELDKVFRNATAAAIFIGGDPNTVYKCLRGERITHLGYTFEAEGTAAALDYLRRNNTYE